MSWHGICEIEGGASWDRRLPVGIRSFEDIKHGGCRYVDKTAYVHRLVHEGNPTLLCRPCGFGKSLLVSTMCAYLEGRHELFEGLEIDSLEENAAHIEGRTPWVARPVFHLDLTGQDHHTASLEEVLADQLARWEETYGASRSSTLCDRFFDLLEAAHEQHGHRAAVLVDGYDRPILDALDDPVMEEHNRCLLGAFFSVLKDADEHLGLVFLTGVTRPSQLFMFGDLSQLRDISLTRDYAGMCGITEDELRSSLSSELRGLAVELGLDADGCLGVLRTRYGGYCFHPDGRGDALGPTSRCVHNPPSWSAR